MSQKEPELLEHAPEFSLRDQEGKLHELSNYRGQWVVLYFYPKDDTPGCTRESCDFRDAYGVFAELGAVVFGVSADDEASHQHFAAKYNLPFPLLIDAGAGVARAYGVWGTKNLYGKISEGIRRQTCLIDPEGKIVRAWRSVKVEGHVQAVAEALREAKLGGVR